MIAAFYILAVLPIIVTIDGFIVQPRIINGIASNTSDYPFFVYIRFGGAYCSGSLISDRYGGFVDFLENV